MEPALGMSSTQCAGKLKRFKNSFYPDAVNSWNNIGPDLRQTDKISAFKSALTGMIVPEEKSIFKIRNKDLRYLYQLRVGLSPLRAHKFRHNFRDTSNEMCTCQSGIESTSHFLLYCPLFDDQRGAKGYCSANYKSST